MSSHSGGVVTFLVVSSCLCCVGVLTFVCCCLLERGVSGRRGNIFVQSKERGVLVACIISRIFFLVVCFLFIISTMFCVSFVNLYWRERY